MTTLVTTEGMARRLIRLGWVEESAEALAILAREVERVRAARDRRMREAAAAGDPVREIAECARVSIAMAYRIIGQE